MSRAGDEGQKLLHRAMVTAVEISERILVERPDAAEIADAVLHCLEFEDENDEACLFNSVDLWLRLECSLREDGEEFDHEKMADAVEFALDEVGYGDTEAALMTAKCAYLNYDPETRA